MPSHHNAFKVFWRDAIRNTYFLGMVMTCAEPGALSSVACTLLLPFRFESLVKLNDALRNMPDQGQGQKDLLRYSLMDKPRNVPESEPFVILWMSYEAASLGIQAFQT